MEEANGDLLSSFVFLLCISAQEKDIHTHSLKSQGCHMLREWDFHLFLKLAVTAGAQPAVCELKRFLLTAHWVCPSVPHFFAFTAVYFCIPVQQTPTEQHLVCWFFVSAAHLLFCFFSTLSLVQHPTSHECKPAEGLCQEAQSSLPSGVPEQALDPFAQCLAKMGMDDVDSVGWRLLVLSGMVSLMCVVFPSMLLVSAPPACGSSHSEVARAVAAKRGFFFPQVLCQMPPTIVSVLASHCGSGARHCPGALALMPGCLPPTEGSPTRGSAAACPQHCLLHPRHFGMDTQHHLPKGSHVYFIFFNFNFFFLNPLKRTCFGGHWPYDSCVCSCRY